MRLCRTWLVCICAYIAFETGAIAQTDGLIDSTFNAQTGPNGDVYALAVQPDGKILVGGSFTTWNGASHVGIVRLAADGSLDATFQPLVAATDGVQVSSIALLSSGSMYVGGTFTTIGGVARPALARLNADGSLDPTFDAKLVVSTVVVDAISLDANQEPIACGSFVVFGSAPRFAIAKFLSSGAVDSSYGPLMSAWAPAPGSTTAAFWLPLPEVNTLALAPDGSIAAAGTQIAYTINNVAFYADPMRFTSAGTFDPDNSPLPSAPVTSIAFESDGTLVAGFSVSGSATDGGAIRRFFANGKIDSSFTPTFVRSDGLETSARVLIADADGRVLVGGDFDQLNGRYCPHLARLLSDGTQDYRFAQLSPDGTALAAVFDAQGNIILGGQFTHLGDLACPHIVRLKNPALPPRLRTSPASIVAADRSDVHLSVSTDPEPNLSYQWMQNGVAIAGATSPDLYLIDVRAAATYTVSVSNLSGTVTSNSALVSVVPRTPGALDSSYAPVLSGHIIPRRDGRVYVFGQTTVALLDADGTVDPGYRIDTLKNPAGGGTITGGWALPDGRVLLRINGGGLGAGGVVRYLADGTWDSTFAVSGLSAVDVEDVVVNGDGSLILGGLFDSWSNPDGVRVLVRVDSSGKYDASYATPRFGMSASITKLAALADGTIVGLGDFSALTGAHFTSTTARFLSDGTQDPNWNEGFGSDQLMPDGTLYRTDQMGTISRIRRDGTSDPGFTCKAQTAIVRTNATFLQGAYPTITQQSDGSLLLSGRIDRVDGQVVSTFARVFSDGTLDTSFVAPTSRNGTALATTGLMEVGEFLYVDATTRLFRDGAGQSRVVNLSARGFASTGDNSLIAGFVVGGGGAANILVRGIGPTLGLLGVTDAIPSATLELYQGTNRVGRNSGWSTLPTDISPVMQRVGAFSLPPNSLDAALSVSLSPGNYGAIVTPTTGDGAEALAEVYSDVPLDSSAWLVNLSARGYVSPSGPPMIVGFSIKGNGAKQILVRAVGQPLAVLGVRNPLPNPKLRLMGSRGEIAENDDAASDGYGGYAVAASHAVGAFDVGQKDSMLLRTLAPGNYTAIVDSSDGGAGIVLVEVYEVTH